MELRTLRAFAEVVRHGGFSRAAKALFATQSTVSKAVKQLEDELGLQLLDRIGHRSALTAAGEIVYRRASAMLAVRDDLVAELDQLRGLKRGTLHLGLPVIGSNTLFAPLFAEYRSRYPSIEIRLVEHGSRRLEKMLLAGEIELAASLLPVREEFYWQEVRREPIDVLVPRKHSLAARKNIRIAELAAFDFILFGEEFALDPIILEACRRSGFAPTVAARSGHVDFIIELVAAGLGIGFLPRMIAQQRRHRDVRHIAVSDSGMDWHLALIWRRSAFLSHAARAWLELAKGGRLPRFVHRSGTRAPNRPSHELPLPSPKRVDPLW